MRSTASNSGAGASGGLNPSGRSLSRIRRWFLQDRPNYEAFERRLAKLESAWRQQMSVQGHAIEIAASVEQRVARTEGDASELARMQPRLAKLESASRQQMSVQGHSIEIAASVEQRVARTEGDASELARMQPRLARLESASRQQVFLHLHAMAIEDRLAAFEKGWRQHIPAFLNAVASVGSFGYELSLLKRELSKLRYSLGDHSELANVVPKLRETIASLENEMRSVLDKSGAVDGEIKGLWDKSGAVDGEIKGLWDKAGAVDKEFSGIWEAGSRYNHEFSDLSHRVEFIRREILFEMRHRAQAERSAAFAPRVLDPAKIEAARRTSHLRVNLGCGHVPLAEFINLDRRDLPGVDIVAEVGNLPFENASVDELFSAHLLEHFPQEELRRRLFPYWISLLKPGGVFRAVVPDGESMVTNLAGGDYSFEDFRSVLFGGQDYDGDFHYNLFTPDSLSSLLEQVGLVAVETPIRGRVNSNCFEFEIQARRPGRSCKRS
jgi:hypothetical protein